MVSLVLRPPPVRAFSFIQSLRHLHTCPQITSLGVTRMGLLTQNRYASYTVSVRQYRILQSDLRSGQSLRNVHRTFLHSLPLHCCCHQQPACDLLILRATNPRIRDFHPLEKIHQPKALFNQKYLYFCTFSLALQQVRSVYAERTHALNATLSGMPLSAIRWQQV